MSDHKTRKTKSAFRLQVKNLGPVVDADISFGDLTVIVGPQATGKSVLLETLKLVIDRDHVHETFSRYNVTFAGNGDGAKAFLGGFYGPGMVDACSKGMEIIWNGAKQSLVDLSKRSKSRGDAKERVFFIPAQRVVSLPKGISQNFGTFDYGDPYVLRRFSDTVHHLLQNEFGAKARLFPQSNRLNDTLRKPISEHFFGGASLDIEARDFTNRLVLKVPGSSDGLPYLAWSAGQREFTPMLLGLYWLCPAGKVSQRDPVQWVVIEEPEMGLHPLAISTLLLTVLELMRRSYRVVISTHSPVVLDMVWALRQFQKLGKDEADVLHLFNLPKQANCKALAKSALEKEYRVFYFDRGKAVQDISSLDPGAEDMGESNWGGLTGFASRAGEAVARAVNRHEAQRLGRPSRSGEGG
ncbi:MAG: ATP-binding protein [Xanthomonadales bacterium]|nr:ATP-binding protein [Xanthomonadales bacterium]MCZ2095899.1 ATP-binding protein [Anaerolineae bacterium]MDL1867994.1 ATP-binding protein [Gammaproteobacteria bacterium PRO6]